MIFRHPSKFPIAKWTDRLKGETAFIIGNGPSLLENDLKKLDGCFTIGINRAFRVILPTILMWQDASLYEDCYEEIKTLPCAKITLKNIDHENEFTHFSLIPGPFRFKKEPFNLYGGGCTTALAIQLAYALGCSSIVLLGCDASYKDNKTDFYGVNRNHTENTLRSFTAALNWANRECPIPILNCGDAIQWQRMSLEKAIESTQPRIQSHISRLSVLL